MGYSTIEGCIRQSTKNTIKQNKIMVYTEKDNERNHDHWEALQKLKSIHDKLTKVENRKITPKSPVSKSKSKSKGKK